MVVMLCWRCEPWTVVRQMQQCSSICHIYGGGSGNSQFFLSLRLHTLSHSVHHCYCYC